MAISKRNLIITAVTLLIIGLFIFVFGFAYGDSVNWLLVFFGFILMALCSIPFYFAFKKSDPIPADTPIPAGSGTPIPPEHISCTIQGITFGPPWYALKSNPTFCYRNSVDNPKCCNKGGDGNCEAHFSPDYYKDQPTVLNWLTACGVPYTK